MKLREVWSPLPTGVALVVIAGVETVIGRVAAGSAVKTGWVATMEPREEILVLDPAGLLELSAELAAVSDLCAFLEEKSRAYEGTDVA